MHDLNRGIRRIRTMAIIQPEATTKVENHKILGNSNNSSAAFVSARSDISSMIADVSTVKNATWIQVSQKQFNTLTIIYIESNNPDDNHCMSCCKKKNHFFDIRN